MSQQFKLVKVSFASLRDYIIEHKVDRGDSLVLSVQDFEHILDEIRHSGEPVPIPINVLGIVLVKDTTGTVENGKIQIVKNEDASQTR
jgi:hypothetical protein